MKKILIVTPRFHPSIGGIEEQARLLGENFIKKDYKTHILTNNFNGDIKKEVLFGLNIYRFSNTVSYIFFLIKNRGYDLIISRQYYKNSFILGLLKFLKILGSKTIIVGDGGTYYNEIEIIKKKLKIFSKIYFFIIGNNNFLIGNNKYFINSLLKIFGKNKVHKIYNGIDVSDMNRKQKTKNIKQILYLSRFDEGKGYMETIKAFKKIENNKLVLNIIGYGEENIENKIKKLIENDDRIVFHGKKYGKEKDNIINNCDLFLFPTYYKGESFGLVLYEIAKKIYQSYQQTLEIRKKYFEII